MDLSLVLYFVVVLFQHYLGMLNFPRRIFNYYCIYFLFNYLGFVGIFGTLLSITIFYFVFLFIYFLHAKNYGKVN